MLLDVYYSNSSVLTILALTYNDLIKSVYDAVDDKSGMADGPSQLYFSCSVGGLMPRNSHNPHTMDKLYIMCEVSFEGFIILMSNRERCDITMHIRPSVSTDNDCEEFLCLLPLRNANNTENARYAVENIISKEGGVGYGSGQSSIEILDGPFQTNRMREKIRKAQINNHQKQNSTNPDDYKRLQAQTLKRDEVIKNGNVMTKLPPRRRASSQAQVNLEPATIAPDQSIQEHNSNTYNPNIIPQSKSVPPNDLMTSIEVFDQHSISSRTKPDASNTDTTDNNDGEYIHYTVPFSVSDVTALTDLWREIEVVSDGAWGRGSHRLVMVLTGDNRNINDTKAHDTSSFLDLNPSQIEVDLDDNDDMVFLKNEVQRSLMTSTFHSEPNPLSYRKEVRAGKVCLMVIDTCSERGNGRSFVLRKKGALLRSINGTSLLQSP